MAKKYLVSLDLNKNEIQNAVIQNLAADPGTPVNGQMYYNTATNKFMWRQNGTFIDFTARTNHTGQQASSTISDLAATVQGYTLNSFAAPSADVSMNSKKITSLADPVNATDAANKGYVDNAVAGLSWKDEVRVATTAAGTLATSFANGQTVDGVVLATNDRILIKNQATATENGIYIVAASGAPTRATDADTGAEMSGAAVYVANGTTNGGSRWVCNTTGTITLGSTNLTFANFGGGGSYTAGNGLTESPAGTFNVGAGTGISVTADAVAVDTAVVARKYTTTVGGATSIAVTHSLGNQYVLVGVFEVSGSAEVECDVTLTDANTVTLGFATAPTAASIRVVVIG